MIHQLQKGCHVRKAAMLIAALGFLPGFGLYADDEVGSESHQFRQVRSTFQKRYAELPRVRVNTQKLAVSFRTYDLSSSVMEIEGKTYCAFRFQTPEETGLFVWSFKVPPKAARWSIMSAVGEMDGFARYTRRKLPRDIPNLGKRGDTFVLQRLATDKLKPNTQYAIWFEFRKGGKPTVTLSLNILPEERHCSYISVFPMLYPGTISMLARVNGWVLTSRKFEQEVGDIIASNDGNPEVPVESFGVLFKSFLGPYIEAIDLSSEKGRRIYLEYLINLHLIAGEARRRDLHVNQEIADTIRKKTAEILALALVGEQLERVQVKSSDVREFYRTEYTRTIENIDRRRVRELVVRSESKAREILMELHEGEQGFAALAKQYSIADSAEQGGDLGYMVYDPDQKFSEFWGEVLSLDERQVSNIFRDPDNDNWYIVRIEDVRKGKPERLASIYDQLDFILRQRKSLQAVRSLRDQARRHTEMDVNEDLLSGTHTPSANKSHRAGSRSVPRNWERTESGLEYIALKKGRGPIPTETDHVKFHFWGALENGSVFESSYEGGKPALRRVKNTIPGLVEGLELMQSGAHYRFRIPAHLAFGAKGHGTIPPNATVIFDVELLDIGSEEATTGKEGLKRGPADP